jgi:hypothetical protein
MVRHITPATEGQAHALHHRASECAQFGIQMEWRDEVQLLWGYDEAIRQVKAVYGEKGEAGLLAWLDAHKDWPSTDG